MEDMSINIEKNCLNLNINKEIYLRILDKAITQTNDDIQMIDQAFTSHDVDKIQTISHRWKGDYDNLRIVELSNIAKELNLIARTNKDMTQMQKLYETFRANFVSLKKFVGNIK